MAALKRSHKNPLNKKESREILLLAQKTRRAAHKEKGGLKPWLKGYSAAKASTVSDYAKRLKDKIRGAKLATRFRKDKWENPKHKPRRHKNPAAVFIGSAVKLHTSAGAIYSPTSKIYGGPGVNAARLVVPGYFHRARLNAKVSKVDYDNRPKAMRSYGKPGRFRHVFKQHPEISSITHDAARRQTVIEIRGSAPIWR